MAKISQIIGREILDSRGNPTVEADVILNNGVQSRYSVPSGATVASFIIIGLAKIIFDRNKMVKIFLNIFIEIIYI